jgi:hypothetical protein
MDGSINAPAFSLRLAVWAGLCLCGGALGFLKLLEFPVGADGWWVSILLMAMTPLAWIAVAVLVWFAQEEIRVEPHAVIVRRWLWGLIGRPGRRISRDTSLRFRLFTGGMGYSALKVVSHAGSVTVDLAFWSTTAKDSLIPSLSSYGLPVDIVQGSILDD